MTTTEPQVDHDADIIPYEAAVVRRVLCELLAELEGDMQQDWNVTLSMLPKGNLSSSKHCPVATWITDRVEGRFEVLVDTAHCAFRLADQADFDRTVVTPEIIGHFIQLFDDEKIPQLIA